MLEPHVSEALRASDRHIVLTGASGWLGRATLDLLQSCIGDDLHRRVRCFGSRTRLLELPDGSVIEQRPLSQLRELDPHPTLLLHFAFLTMERAEQMTEGEYRAANEQISRTILEALDPIGAEAVFVASSGAARYSDAPEASPAMRLYGTLKRNDERRFAEWARVRKKTATIARVHNLSGPYINKTESYALACFILDGLAGGPISVRAGHEVWRGYVAVRELISLALAMQLDPNPDVKLFDTGGDPIELGDLAWRIARHLNILEVHRSGPDGHKVDRYLGDDLQYRSFLGRYGVCHVPIEHQITETVKYLANTVTFKGVRDWPGQCEHGSRESSRDSALGRVGSTSIRSV